ncbi:ROK family protein [Streptomyces sp. NPDC008139]|uniref:ROK family transcriptional regulator n=1 Tax=Streptomyces sp. NPDC008139 TaxID=3364814 RepID=UPI0036E92129
MSIQYRVLSRLRDLGPLSRAQLSDELEMPRPRLVAELDRMIASGTILEAGPAASRGGRRSTLVQLDPELRFAAVDLGASSIDVEITDGRLAAVASYSESADIRQGPGPVLDRVSELLRKLGAQSRSARLDTIGIGLPGPVSFRDGVSVSPPIMPGWDRFPVRSTLTSEHGCPVVVDNDVNLMALGEHHSGVARSVDNLLFVYEHAFTHQARDLVTAIAEERAPEPSFADALEVQLVLDAVQRSAEHDAAWTSVPARTASNTDPGPGPKPTDRGQ